MIEKQSSAGLAGVRVTFRMSRAIWADRVAVVGDFNGADQEAFPMIQSVLDPDWHITLDLDLDRRYRFFYLCDGERNSAGDADDFGVDYDGHAYGIVDTSMHWPLPRLDDMATAMLACPAWLKLGGPP
jgi:hypothetical protein